MKTLTKERRLIFSTSIFLLSVLTYIPTYSHIVNSGSSSNLIIASSTYVCVGGNLKNQSSGILINNGNIYIKGDIDNSSTFTSGGSSNIKFYGSSAQIVSSTSTLQLQDAEIDNALGVTISNNLQINGIITLTNGLINTNANTLIVENTSTAAIVGYNTNSYVNGILKRKMETTGSYDFPVGTSSNYELANINLVASTITYLIANFTIDNTGTDISGLGISVSGTAITTRLNYGWWTLSPESGSSTNYDVTLTSNGHTNGGTEAMQHTVLKGVGGTETWQSLGTHSNATQSGTGSSSITAKRTALNSFSDFCIARSDNNPLPIELLSFSAECSQDNKNEVELSWSTSSENNNDYFIIERSEDGIAWYVLDAIEGTAFSNSILNYHYLAYNPEKNFIYYRLKQIDFDGDFTYSNIAIVNCSENPISIISVYPNPAIDDFEYIICSSESTDVYINMFDAFGQYVMKKNIHLEKGETKLSLDISMLASSVYMLQVRTTIGDYKDSKYVLIK